jgi:hypothetical protein
MDQMLSRVPRNRCCLFYTLKSSQTAFRGDESEVFVTNFKNQLQAHPQAELNLRLADYIPSRVGFDDFEEMHAASRGENSYRHEEYFGVENFGENAGN